MHLLLLLACSPTDPVDTSVHGTLDLPEHSECLPPGEVMDAETCAAVVEHDGRLPTEPSHKTDAPPDPADPRIDDADLNQLLADTRRCTCACCHDSTLGGPGAYFWDVTWQPVWIDSANDWSLGVFAGIYESENQSLPHEDPDWVRAVIQAELDRRDSL